MYTGITVVRQLYGYMGLLILPIFIVANVYKCELYY